MFHSLLLSDRATSGAVPGGMLARKISAASPPNIWRRPSVQYCFEMS